MWSKILLGDPKWKEESNGCNLWPVKFQLDFRREIHPRDGQTLGTGAQEGAESQSLEIFKPWLHKVVPSHYQRGAGRPPLSFALWVIGLKASISLWKKGTALMTVKVVRTGCWRCSWEHHRNKPALQQREVCSQGSSSLQLAIPWSLPVPLGTSRYFLSVLALGGLWSAFPSIQLSLGALKCGGRGGCISSFGLQWPRFLTK